MGRTAGRTMFPHTRNSPTAVMINPILNMPPPVPQTTVRNGRGRLWVDPITQTSTKEVRGGGGSTVTGSEDAGFASS